MCNKYLLRCRYYVRCWGFRVEEKIFFFVGVIFYNDDGEGRGYYEIFD